MQFLIVGLKKGSQISRFREEGKKLGIDIKGCLSSELVVKSSGGKFEVIVGETDLSGFDLIYLCAGVESKKRLEWFVACKYLKAKYGVRIVNQAIVDEKLGYLPNQTWSILKMGEHNIPQPKTYVVYDASSLDKITSELGFPLIVKLSDTHQGKGIFMLNNVSEIRHVMKVNPGNTYLIREYIPNDGDIRVFVVGGRAIGAMKRIAKKDEFRSNISVGGRGIGFDLSKNQDIKRLAEKTASVCGVEVAGVDIMLNKKTNDPYVLEVNVGPQFKGLEKYTGINVAQEIIKFFIAKSSI